MDVKLIAGSVGDDVAFQSLSKHTEIAGPTVAIFPAAWNSFRLNFRVFCGRGDDRRRGRDEYCSGPAVSKKSTLVCDKKEDMKRYIEWIIRCRFLVLTAKLLLTALAIYQTKNLRESLHE